MADVRQAGPIVEATAGEALGGHRAVAIVGNAAYHADKNTAAHRGLVRGITTGAAASTDTARIQVYGPMAEPSFAFTPGQPIFVGTDGHLTQTAPTSGWLQQVAVAETETRIFIDLQPIIALD